MSLQTTTSSHQGNNNPSLSMPITPSDNGSKMAPSSFPATITTASHDSSTLPSCTAPSPLVQQERHIHVTHPTVATRMSSTIVGHTSAAVLPASSDHLPVVPNDGNNGSSIHTGAILNTSNTTANHMNKSVSAVATPQTTASQATCATTLPYHTNHPTTTFHAKTTGASPHYHHVFPQHSAHSVTPQLHPTTATQTLTPPSTMPVQHGGISVSVPRYPPPNTVVAYPTVPPASIPSTAIPAVATSFPPQYYHHHLPIINGHVPMVVPPPTMYQHSYPQQYSTTPLSYHHQPYSHAPLHHYAAHHPVIQQSHDSSPSNASQSSVQQPSSSSSSLQEQFDQAVRRVQDVMYVTDSGVRIEQSDMFDLYGLYKQATIGDNPHPPVSFFKFRERAKHNAWKERQGMNRKEAMKCYIDKVREIEAKIQRQQ